MSATDSGDTRSGSRLFAWAGSVGSFVVATGLQIAIFGLVVPNNSLSKLAAPIGMVLAVAWFVLPAAIATFLAVRTFRLIGPLPERRSAQSLLAVLLLPLLSVYLGMVVSFNTWGGK